MAYRTSPTPITRSLVGPKELLMMLVIVALIAVPFVAAVAFARQLIEIASASFGS
jgi:hypothetical protein